MVPVNFVLSCWYLRSTATVAREDEVNYQSEVVALNINMELRKLVKD